RATVAHPIDVASGVLSQSFEDYVIPGFTPLVFTRRYSTGRSEENTGMFGPGWACGLEIRLLRDLDGYSLLLANGESRVPFDDFTGALEDGATIRDPGSFCELRCHGNEIIATRWDPESFRVQRYYFSVPTIGQWSPLKALDSPGQPLIELAYDSAGRLTI